MGAVDHSRIVPLWRETARSYRSDAHGRVIAGSETAGERTPISVREAWIDVSSQEAYEDGHSYSGNFGSKRDQPVLIASDERLTRELLTAIDELVRAYMYGSESDFAGLDPRDSLGRGELSRAAEAIVGQDNLRKAAEVFENKWGPAAAIAGADHVWFGGTCSS